MHFVYENPFKDKVILNADTFYFLCTAGIGDTMLLCGFYEQLLKKWGAPIQLLIKKNHEFLMEMYEIKNYTIVELNGINLFKLSDACKVPQKGKIFVAHPHVHIELETFFRPVRDQYSVVRFAQWFLEFLDLPIDLPIAPPHVIPQMLAETERRCRSLAPIDKIVMLSPEATSTSELPQLYWEMLTSKLNKQGYTVISNVIKPENCIANSYFLPNLTSREAVALGYQCAGVYSIRSGLCDALHLMGSRLHVFYPSHSSWFLYNLNVMFSRQDIDERICLNI